VYELPGVGAHLQDHLATEVVFRTTAETAASIKNSASEGNTTSFLSFINSAIAYANITDLFGDWATEFHQQVKANMSANVNSLIPDDPRVKKGYQAIYEAATDKILLSPAGQVPIPPSPVNRN
jgi:choline dehydrogenase